MQTCQSAQSAEPRMGAVRASRAHRANSIDSRSHAALNQIRRNRSDLRWRNRDFVLVELRKNIATSFN
jgi:hypothetical protein